jgi:hypothetical protein
VRRIDAPVGRGRGCGSAGWRHRLALLAALAVAGGAALADEGLRLSGFGTLGYAGHSRSDIAPARDISQLPADGYRTGASWRLDTRLGVQLEYAVSPSLDLVGQAVLRDHFHADVNSTIELAYAAIKPRHDLDLRVGRINYDAFLMSDHRNVGYAYTWLRPPAEFYGWIPIFSLDGVDAAYHLAADEGRWRVKLQAGRAKVALPIDRGYDFRANNLLGASLTRQTASWRLKAAYSQFTVGSEVPFFAPLHAGLEQVAAAGIPQVSAEAADLRRNLGFAGTKVTYTTLGAAYDDGVWIAQAELGRSTASSAVVPHGSMAYASVGRRFGDWTPYLLLSASRPGNDRRAAANSWGAFDATLRDPALFVVNATRIEQRTLAVGARWDVHRQAALKVQWEHTHIQPAGYGLWWRDLALKDRKTPVEQVSATLDFIF